MKEPNRPWPATRSPIVLAYDRKHPRDKSLDWLRERGVEVRLGRAQTDPGFKRYSEDDIIAAARGVDAVLGLSSAHFTRRVIEALPDLRFISKVGVGYDTIDIAAATERGILVSNTLESAGTGAVAEHAIALMLSLCKRLHASTAAFMRQGGWRDVERFSTGIEGSTIGIVGFGRIGRAVAHRLAGWNARIMAHDPHANAPAEGATMVDLPTLLAQSDIVTLHCDATADNHHMIGREALAMMKPTAILINTARGALVDSEALTESLKAGRLAGAGLDVYEEEPPDPASDLFTQENIVVTPHVSARTLDIFLDRHRRAAENLWAMINGSGHADLVNPEARARSDARRQSAGS